MIGYLSSEGVNQLFKQWSIADPNIESYGYGQLYDSNGNAKADQKYNAMWVQPVNTTVEDWVILRNYQILIYGLVYQSEGGETNQNKLISDCEEIAFRLIRFLKKGDEIFNVTTPPTVSPFSDRFLDDVSGVIIDIQIEFNAESSNCLDPDYVFDIIKNEIN
jgi:hypothetical protein